MLKSDNALVASRAGRSDADATAKNSSKAPEASSIAHGWNFTFDGHGTQQNDNGKDAPDDLEKTVLGLDQDVSELFNMLPAWTELQMIFDNNSNSFDIVSLEGEVAMRAIPVTNSSGLQVIAANEGTYAMR